MLFILYKTQYIETMEVIYLVPFLKAPSVNLYSKRPSNVKNVHLPLLIINCSRGINYPQCVDKDKANLFPFLVGVTKRYTVHVKTAGHSLHVHLSFSQTHKIGNIGIITNFVISIYLQCPSLFATFDVSKYVIKYQSM